MYPHVKQFETRLQEVARRLEHIEHAPAKPRRTRLFARSYASGR
jgi:hypothetical protein